MNNNAYISYSNINIYICGVLGHKKEIPCNTSAFKLIIIQWLNQNNSFEKKIIWGNKDANADRKMKNLWAHFLIKMKTKLISSDKWIPACLMECKELV